MAQRTIVVDDVSGDEIPQGQARDLVVGLDGQWYHLDVAEETDERVREYMNELVESAAKIDAPPKKRVAKVRDYDVPTVRKWAKENGHTVSVRGAIPADVLAAWRAAHAGQREQAALLASQLDGQKIPTTPGETEPPQSTDASADGDFEYERGEGSAVGSDNGDAGAQHSTRAAVLG